MGIFDALMKRLRDPQARAVFDSWLKRDECKWQENDVVAPEDDIAVEAAS